MTTSSTHSLPIDGIIPIVPTPFQRDEQIDWKALRGLIEFACAAGACGACLPAYASEFYKLSEEERQQVVAEAVEQASGRIPIIGQVNYLSVRQAVAFALRVQQCGAAAVCVAVPRLVALAECDLYRYFDRILSVLEIPLIIQDLSSAGLPLSPAFLAALHRAHPHFRFVKLEDPLMAGRVEAIRQETGGGVGVLEGWGGMYMQELVPAGLSGVMPDLALTDLLERVYRLLSNGKREEASQIFQVVLPWIVFSLQNMEVLHHAEKRLLQARGVLDDIVVREPTLQLQPQEEEHIRFLNARILVLLDQLGFPRNPAVAHPAVRH